MPERKVKTTTTKALPTLESARTEILAKISKAAAKGAAPITAATKEPKRSLFVQALADLEAERVVFADRSKAAPKYFLIEFAPSVTSVAAKLEQAAAMKHPALLAAPELKKVLTKQEQPCFAEAFESLESSQRLVRLMRKTSAVFAHGDSLRAILGVSTTPAAPAETPHAAVEPAVSSSAIRETYANLVRLTGFPAVEIAALQLQSGVPMAALKEWLLAEHRSERADFGLGDWSLADETTRAGVIELYGDRYLFVELKG